MKRASTLFSVPTLCFHSAHDSLAGVEYTLALSHDVFLLKLAANKGRPGRASHVKPRAVPWPILACQRRAVLSFTSSFPTHDDRSYFNINIFSPIINHLAKAVHEGHFVFEDFVSVTLLPVKENLWKI